MGIFGGFFKKHKYQKFEYLPRYWNPEKEDLMHRVKVAKGEAGNDPEAMKRRISKHIRRTYKSGGHSRKKSNMRSTILLLGVICVLVIISYYLLTVYLPQLEEILK